MRIKISEVKDHPEGYEIKAVVFWRGLPPPDYQGRETDEEYAERVKHLALDITSCNNLHPGWAELTQELWICKVPNVAEYDS
jgi:hypothetical protein